MDIEDAVSLDHDKSAKEDDGKIGEETDFDDLSIPPSPTFTDYSATSHATTSALSLPSVGTTDSKDVQKRKAKSEAASRLSQSSHRAKSKPSVQSESIYNLRKCVRNPITGEVSELAAKHSLSNLPAREVVAARIVQEQGRVPTARKRSQSAARRNPITGEGVETVLNPVNVKNYARSGIRVKQPPGGISSGIF